MIREFVVDKTLPLSEHVSVESAAPLVGQAWVQDHWLCECMASLAEVWSVVLGGVSGHLPSLETGLSAGQLTLLLCL